MKKELWIIGSIALLGLVAVAIVAVSDPSSNENASLDNLPIQGKKVSIQGRQHIAEGEDHPSYNSNPPTSGWHYDNQADWGFYEESLPDERAVHNLEHGGIWISYKKNEVSTSTLLSLKNLAQKYNHAVIITPRSENDTTIALASWGRLMKLDDLDKYKVENFIKANVNNSPEKFVTLEKAKVAVGNPAPEATFTTIDGQTATLSEFENEKVVLWLFATWCPSCKQGARALQENNRQLSNMKIVGVKTYSNAGYSGPSVPEFVKSFSPELLKAKNWAWGNFSQESTKVYNPRNLPDIYFLIDEEGIIREINTAPAATIDTIVNFAKLEN